MKNFNFNLEDFKACALTISLRNRKEASTKIVEGVLCPKTLQKLIKQERLQDKREFEGYVIRPRIKRHYDRHESKFPRQSVQYR